nr:synaptobrevin, longin-like domain protein [Tanacetum cinerariifolium]
MAALIYRDEHNKVGYQLKPIGSDDYHQIINFLRASHIRYALTHNPIIFDSLVKQFWSTATLKSPELADDGGIDDLPITEIYSGMDNLGYVTEGKLTFFKNKFSPQWRFLVHTILHCLSTKSGSWDQFGSPLVVALICLFDGRQFNWSSYIYKGMVSIIRNAKKFLMYPRFLQTILGIETSIKRQYQVLKFSSKLFSNTRLNFEGHPMLLLAAMLSQDQEGEGDAEDFIALTDLSSVVSTLVQKVKAMEVKLRTTKRKMVVSDSDQEEGGKQDMDLDALLTLANADVTVDSNIPPGGASNNPAASTSVYANVPTRANVLAGSTSVPADVPTSVALAGVSNKGKNPMVEEDITIKERTFKQMKEDRLREQAVKRLHDEEKAQVEDNASLSKTLMGDDVSKDNFPARMSSAVYSTKWSMARVKSFTDDQLKEEFENIQKALLNIQIQAFSRTLKRTGPVLEEPSSKRQKSTEAPILYVPEVPQSPVVSSPKSFGTRRKSLGRKRLTKPKSKLKELDLDADDQTFIKVVSNEDFENKAPLLWSALVGWEVITTPLGDINALYRIDRSIVHFTTLREILYMVDRHDLVTLYGLVVKYYENHLVAGAGLILWGDL